MARLIIANNAKGMRIERSLVDSIHNGVVEILKSRGAYEVSDGEASRSGPKGSSGNFSETYEIPEMGSANVRSCFIAEGDISDYFSNSVELIGVPDLWKVGAEVPKQIKQYFAELGLPIYRDEITTAEGTKFVKGSRISTHMQEHGAESVSE